jgi:hypothetical protein
MSSRKTSTSSDVEVVPARNVEELEGELQTTKSMLDQLRVAMKKREAESSRSKQEAEVSILNQYELTTVWTIL